MKRSATKYRVVGRFKEGITFSVERKFITLFEKLTMTITIVEKDTDNELVRMADHLYIFMFVNNGRAKKRIHKFLEKNMNYSFKLLEKLNKLWPCHELAKEVRQWQIDLRKE